MLDQFLWFAARINIEHNALDLFIVLPTHDTIVAIIIIDLGGLLGWKVRGSLLADFEKVAYELEPSTVGNPRYAEVKTREGYHIIMVEGRK